MKEIKDVFFANLSGSITDNFHLDLYLPDNQEVPGQGDTVKNLKEVDDVTTEYTEQSTRNTQKQAYYDYNADISGVDCCYDVRYVEPEYVTDLCMKHEEQNARNVTRRIKDVPLVIFVHGGGWRRGGREAWTHYLYFDVNFLVAMFSLLIGTYKNVGQALAKNGIACAVISYPLTEAGLLPLFAELFLSYVQSCFAVALISLPILGLASLEPGFRNSYSHAWWHHLQEDKAFLFKTFILGIMLVTNLLTIGFLSIKKKEYKLRTCHIRFLWLFLLTGLLLMSFSIGNNLTLMVILTLFINQSVILRLRLSRCGGCYEDQTNVLAMAVKWAKTVGHDTGVFDQSRIYLMGHSAGGHLVSLAVLDEDILSKVGCSSNDIKGVVSLSGVYDLMCLHGPLLRPFYLLPTFGHCRNTWLRASPIHLMKAKDTKDDRSHPKFLLFVAENDLFLKQQSEKFSEILQEAEVDCRHIEIRGTNHFTIVTKLKKKFLGNEKSVLTHITHFVQN